MRTRDFFSHVLGIGLGLVLSGSTHAVERAAESRWTPSPLQVDGRADEWPADNLRFEKKPGVSYAFKNDARSLYILIVFNNPKSLEAAQATGMAIYYSPAGIREKTNGTRFLKEDIPVDRFISLLENQGKVLTDEDKGILRTRYQYPIFVASAIDQAGQYIPAAGPQPDAEPPVFRAAKSDSAMIYEFRIPLAPRAPHPPGPGAEPGKIIKVGFEWGGSAMKVLSAKGSWESPPSRVSDDVMTRWGETEAQEFLSSFDRLSRPSLKTKEYALWVDVRLASHP